MVQVPQSIVPPHMSLAMPQSKPCDMHVCLLHGGIPHTFCVPPPPQVAGAVHVPQFCTLPQPSGAIPQSRLSWLQLLYAAHMPPPAPVPPSGTMKVPVDPLLLVAPPAPVEARAPPVPLPAPLADVEPPAFTPLEPRVPAECGAPPHDAAATTIAESETRSH
jgi:hypothetical protein